MRLSFFISVIRLTAHVTPFNAGSRNRRSAALFTAEGIDVFLYFSILEWNNPNYMGSEPKTDEEKQKVTIQVFKES